VGALGQYRRSADDVVDPAEVGHRLFVQGQCQLVVARVPGQ
jgi:hypothetical protein